MLALSLLLLVSIAWTFAVVIAPVADSRAIFAAASLVCHQAPERSFHANSGPMAVCARCLGLYAGGVAGLALAWAAGIVRTGRALPPRVARWLLLLAALPTAATLGAEWLGGWPVGNLPRFAAAVPLGFVAAAGVGLAILGDARRFRTTEVD